MRTLFVDTVANRFPTIDTVKAPRHCVRISLWLWDGADPMGEVQRYLVKSEGWTVNAQMMPYLRAHELDFEEQALSASDVVQDIASLFEDANEVVAYNAAYHLMNTEALFEDAEKPWIYRPWHCAMLRSAQIMKLPVVRGRPGMPRMPDAFRYFTGEDVYSYPTWDGIAIEAVRAVAEIWHGIMNGEGTDV